jgi:serine/threonine-protein kinase
VDEATKEASLIGSTLGDRYRLIEAIGEGGMGRVYRAEQLATGKAVALKLLHPEFVGVDQVVRRFEREAKVMTEVAHPGIVKVIELGEWNGRLFLAMELLAGKSLAEQLVREGGQGGKAGKRLTVKRTLAIIRPVLDALEYAHALGVVHRDLKPENIMIIPGGLLSRESIKLLDFGIAKLGDRSVQANQKLTQHGMVLGTPAYMAPEQAAGQEADVRSDVYSCGIILYQLLTGHRPFEGDANIDVLLMHINTQPKSLRAVADGAWIPDAVERVVLRALAKRPAQRFQSAGQLRQALEQAVVVDYGHAGARETARAPARMSAGSRFLCLAIIGAAVTTLLGDHLRSRRASAANNAAVAGATAPARPGDSEKQAAPETGRPSPEPAKAKAKHRSAKHARSTSKRGAARSR